MQGIVILVVAAAMAVHMGTAGRASRSIQCFDGGTSRVFSAKAADAAVVDETGVFVARVDGKHEVLTACVTR